VNELFLLFKNGTKIGSLIFLILMLKKNLVLTGTDAADIFNESFVLIYIYLNL